MKITLIILTFIVSVYGISEVINLKKSNNVIKSNLSYIAIAMITVFYIMCNTFLIYKW